MADNAEPGRMMANEIFATFDDADGNFIEQFQTTGFDSRIFELFLHGYFSRSGFCVDRSQSRPDFLIEGPMGRAAVEATTSNRERSFDMEQVMRDVDALTPEVQREVMRGELPIRLGGPLFDKLKKQYWTLAHCAGLPLIIAIEAFHTTTSLLFTSSALCDYLYGVRHHGANDSDGNLHITSTPIETHVLGSKSIPSGFFDQPNAEHISAVVFSNSGTWGKFTRMGYQSGYHRGNLSICRKGLCHDPDPKAAEPREFFYWLDEPPHEESWGEGLEVFHNPRALIRLPRGYFPNAADHVLKNGVIDTLGPSFHPFMSHMTNIAVSDFEVTRECRGVVVDSIMQREFDELVNRRVELLPMLREREWLGDRSRKMLGVLIEDKVDKDWSYVVVAPRGAAEAMQSGFASRDEARMAAVDALVQALEGQSR